MGVTAVDLGTSSTKVLGSNGERFQSFRFGGEYRHRRGDETRFAKKTDATRDIVDYGGKSYAFQDTGLGLEQVSVGTAHRDNLLSPSGLAAYLNAISRVNDVEQNAILALPASITSNKPVLAEVEAAYKGEFTFSVNGIPFFRKVKRAIGVSQARAYLAGENVIEEGKILMVVCLGFATAEFDVAISSTVGRTRRFDFQDAFSASYPSIGVMNLLDRQGMDVDFATGDSMLRRRPAGFDKHSWSSAVVSEIERMKTKSRASQIYIIGGGAQYLDRTAVIASLQREEKDVVKILTGEQSLYAVAAGAKKLGDSYTGW